MSGPLGSAQWMYASGAEVTQQSLKFNDDESQYLSWTPVSAGNRKTWTWSGWVKRGNIDTTLFIFGAGPDSDNQTFLRVNTNNQLQFRNEVSNSIKIVESSAVFRDASAWYHIVVVYDSSNSTANDRMRIYVNGERITDINNNVPPSLNLDSFMNSSSYEMFISRQRSGATSYFDGYLSDIHFIDGQALDASSFGQFTDGYWEAIDYAGTYGTNGFHLTFEDDVVSEGFNAVTYRGTGADQSISGLGFEPDFVWIKQRDGTPSHALFDSVRGADNVLRTNGTDAENASGISTALYGGLTSFDSDGFTVDDGTDTTYDATNGSGDSYVAWAWDAGSGSAASNTEGSITSTVKANPSYGFSIVSYTSPNNAADQTVGHGLSQAPEVIICKNLDTTYNWDIYHSGTGSVEDTLTFTSAATRDFDVFTTTAPTSTVFGTKNNFTHAGTNRYIAYCFNSVAGYSSIGSYEGDGTTNGSNAVTLGFKPAFVMIKNVDDTAGWHMFDNTRDTVSPIGKYLTADTSDAESTLDLIEFTNTGFAPIFNGNAVNHTGETYIYMAFADTREAAFWKDVSGQGNHWTPNNLDYRDSLIDSPANNFAVLNPLVSLNAGSSGNGTLSEGNLKCVWSGSLVSGTRQATIGVSSGKWYYEADWEQNGSNNATYGFIGSDGTLDNGRLTISTSGKYMCAVDMDNLLIWFGVNGVWTGDPDAGTGGTSLTDVGDRFPFFRDNSGSSGQDWTVIANFGQDSTFAGNTTAGGNQDDNGIGDFKYAPPSGYLALCTANLPTPTIIDGSEYFNTVLYSGSNSAQSITGVGFQPDWVWLKNRNYGPGVEHVLTDSVRGATKRLESNTTDSEVTQANDLQSFDADGFTVGGGQIRTSSSGYTYASWNWKAGGTAVSNTAGSITSQVSANTDAGFSIVSWVGDGTSQGATVGHSLGTVPSMIIVKSTDSVAGWNVWHKDLTNATTSRVLLNDTGDEFDSVYVWGSTAPDNSTFGVGTVGTTTWTNRLSRNYIAYCFANTDGYLKAGSYTGNGSTDGTFVYTGFRPAFVITKFSSSTSNWVMFDAERNNYNVIDDWLLANSSNAEGTGTALDFLSNGFKLRASGSGWNDSGTYIYLAFAETPFKYANAR